jgi:hypothetical protein
MKKDESVPFGDRVIELTQHQQNAALYDVLRDHMEARLQALRVMGDNPKETPVESSLRKGRIAEIKDFLKATQRKSPVLKNTSTNYI